jgi:hypothetical protein
MRTLTVSRLYRRHFVARLAGTALSSNLLINSHLELERGQQTARKNCKRRGNELWHAFFATLCAGFQRVQVSEFMITSGANTFAALRPAALRIGSFWDNRTFRQ